jgi:hypothetical protein
MCEETTEDEAEVWIVLPFENKWESEMSGKLISLYAFQLYIL